LESAVGLAQTQLIAQSARIDALDLKAFALLGLDAALVAALLAARSDLGRHWWVAMIGIGLSVLFGTIAAVGTENGLKQGPEPEDFYKSKTWSSDTDFLTDLLAWLQRSLKSNVAFEDSKRGMVSAGATFLVLTGAYSTFVFAFWR
jgi:hypothetical protein